MSEVRRKHDLYKSHGITPQILDEESLQDAEPNLAGDLPGGLLVESDSVVYQLPATRYLIARASADGAVLRTGQQAVEISDAGVRLADGDQISAAKVINAAGAHAADLTPELKIRKRKGHLVITERYDRFAGHQLVELGHLSSAHGSEYDSVAFNVQPRKTGQVLLGSSRQFDAQDTSVDEAYLHKMTQRAFEYMPKLRELSAVRVWTG